jgi:hypothetical protein
MTDTLNNPGSTPQSSVTLPHRERVDVNKRSGAQDETEEVYPFELMPVGDPRPQSK